MIIHRDIKLENIVIERFEDEDWPVIKLIDFGFSRKVQMNQNMTQAVGSGYYMAPEVLKNNPYDFKADVWSASIVVFIMLSGDMPFYGKNSEEMINCINKSDLNRTFSMKKW